LGGISARPPVQRDSQMGHYEHSLPLLSLSIILNLNNNNNKKRNKEKKKKERRRKEEGKEGTSTI
jgi:hypothetical protein